MSLVITTESTGMLEIKIRLFPITAGSIFTAVTAFWLSAPVGSGTHLIYTARTESYSQCLQHQPKYPNR